MVAYIFLPSRKLFFNLAAMQNTISKKTIEKKRRGRKALPACRKQSHRVGSFWLTSSEKEEWDKKFKASGLENQGAFFRKVFFDGQVKLYYSDINTKRIYDQLLSLEKEINHIGVNYNQIVKRVNSVPENKILHNSLKELILLAQQIEARMQQVVLLFETHSLTQTPE
jgi:hypothetical protein